MTSESQFLEFLYKLNFLMLTNVTAFREIRSVLLPCIICVLPVFQTASTEETPDTIADTSVIKTCSR